MPDDHPGTAPRRRAFGIDLSRPGVEKDHFVCAGHYTFTSPGLCEVVRSRTHVWVCTAFVYAEGVRSDRLNKLSNNYTPWLCALRRFIVDLGRM